MNAFYAKNKKIIWIALGVAAIGGAYWYWNKKKKEKEALTPPAVAPIVAAAQQVANAKTNIKQAGALIKGQPAKPV
jgi:hypothetical protein